MALQIKAKTSDADKHEYDVNTLITHNGNIYSGADDGKIIKWDENLKKLGEVQAHPCSIYCLTTNGTKIYSCSNDGTVKSWSLELNAIATIVQDDCEFWKVIASNDILYVGDDKGALRTFIDDKPIARYELLEGIKELTISGNLMFTGKDIDVTITELSEVPKLSFATRKVMQGRAPIALAGDKFIFVDFPATGFSVHENSSESNFKQIATVQGVHTMIINAIAGTPGQQGDVVFYTGAWDKTIKKWKLSDGSVQMTDTVDVGHVVNACIVDEKGSLFAGLSDGYLIKI